MQIYENRSVELKKLHKNEVTRFMDSLGDKEAQEKYMAIKLINYCLVESQCNMHLL